MGVIDKIKSSTPAINEKQRNLIVGVVLLGIFLLDYFFVMGPQLKNLRTVAPKVSILSEDLKKARDNLQREGQYRESVTKLKNQLGKVNLKVKTKEEVPMILERISTIANSNNIAVDQMNPLVESQDLLLENEEGKYFELPIQIQARSGYHDLGRFLSAVEGDDVSLTLDRFTFSARPTDRKLHLSRLTFKAIVLEKGSNKE